MAAYLDQLRLIADLLHQTLAGLPLEYAAFAAGIRAQGTLVPVTELWNLLLAEEAALSLQQQTTIDPPLAHPIALHAAVSPPASVAPSSLSSYILHTLGIALSQLLLSPQSGSPSAPLSLTVPPPLPRPLPTPRPVSSPLLPPDPPSTCPTKPVIVAVEIADSVAVGVPLVGSVPCSKFVVEPTMGLSNADTATMPCTLDLPQARHLNAQGGGPRSSEWLLDSGASDYITPDSGHITTSSSSLDPSHVYIGNGYSLPVSSTGSTTLPLPHSTLRLNTVLHTPNIAHNLLFVYKLTQDNACSLTFTASDVSIQDNKTKCVFYRGPS